VQIEGFGNEKGMSFGFGVLAESGESILLIVLARVSRVTSDKWI